MSDDFSEYTIRVSYLHSDCCQSFDDDAVVTLFAKSPEQARGMAKRAIEDVWTVHETYTTYILEDGDDDS